MLNNENTNKIEQIIEKEAFLQQNALQESIVFFCGTFGILFNSRAFLRVDEVVVVLENRRVCPIFPLERRWGIRVDKEYDKDKAIDHSRVLAFVETANIIWLFRLVRPYEAMDGFATCSSSENFDFVSSRNTQNIFTCINMPMWVYNDVPKSTKLANMLRKPWGCVCPERLGLFQNRFYCFKLIFLNLILSIISGKPETFILLYETTPGASVG